MPDNAPLLRQLANRAKLFHSNTGITQTQIARAIGVDGSNYSSFLAGRTGINSEAVCRLLKYTSLTQRQAVAAFSKPVFSANVLNLQEKGRHLRFDNNGWLPREGGTDDPNGTGSITGSSDAQRQAVENLLSVLAELDELTRQAVVGSIAKAYPNPYGTTASNGQRFSRKR
jgi:transcriptional regulator with XRE-family HTH domain